MMKPERTPLSKKPRVPPKPIRTIERKTEVDPVEVFCRIRPIDNAEDVCITPLDTCTIKLTPPETSTAFRNGSAKEQTYVFQNVFTDQATQKDIYNRVGKPLVADLLSGKNGLLFAYGVTGSGKTYTMQGTSKDGGMVMRTLDTIFNSIKAYQTRKFVFKPDRMNGFDVQTEREASFDRHKEEYERNSSRNTRHRPITRRFDASGASDTSDRIPDRTRIGSIDEDNVYSLFVSYIEIYNNYIYDLLEDIPETNIAKNLQSKILKDDGNNMYVHNCAEIEVKNAEEAIEVLNKGQKRRKVAHTRLNMESSRSHSIFNIRIVQAPLDEQGEEVVTDKSLMTVSQLSLVDLAGSERTSRTHANGMRVKEAGNINNSLMSLRACMEILRENQMNSNSNKIVPYRDCRLTHFFKNYFNGEGKVKMIVCVNPSNDDYDETLPVMKFAQLASEVQIQKVSTSVKRDIGLMAGRRRANQIFKEVRKKLQEEGDNVDTLKLDVGIIYSLGPVWPSIQINDESSQEIMDTLKEHLRKRIQNRENLKNVFNSKVVEFRQELVEVENENVLLKQENRQFKSLYNDAMKKIRALETLVINSEAANESLQRKFADYKTLSDNYHAALEERDHAKATGQIEKQRLKSRLKAKVEAEREKMEKEMMDKFNELKSSLKMQMYNNHVKVIKSLYPTDEFNPEYCSTRNKEMKRENDCNEARTPVVQAGNSNANRGRQPTTTALRHRRSRSTGAAVTWVDHCPDQILAEPTTVLQPNLPRRRSLAQIKSEDLLSDKPLGYCLTTHDLASDGELETKIVKGDVLPTVGGGAQVVFQDVEMLRQRDVLSGTKRRSDGTPRVDRTTLHDRCAIGISNTPRSHLYKRPRI